MSARARCAVGFRLGLASACATGGRRSPRRCAAAAARHGTCAGGERRMDGAGEGAVNDNIKSASRPYARASASAVNDNI